VISTILATVVVFSHLQIPHENVAKTAIFR